MRDNKNWGIRNCKEVDLADELLLDVLSRIRKKYPNDKDFGTEVASLLERLEKGVEEIKSRLN